MAGPSPTDERHLVLFHVLVVGTHDHGVPGEAVLWGMGGLLGRGEVDG